MFPKTWLALFVLAAWAPVVKAQGPLGDYGDQGASEGLESATPTDNLDELNAPPGNYNSYGNGGEGGADPFGGDSPAAEEEEGSFDVPDGAPPEDGNPYAPPAQGNDPFADYGNSNSLFNNGSGNKLPGLNDGANYQSPSAFGGKKNPAAPNSAPASQQPGATAAGKNVQGANLPGGNTGGNAGIENVQAQTVNPEPLPGENPSGQEVQSYGNQATPGPAIDPFGGNGGAEGAQSAEEAPLPPEASLPTAEDADLVVDDQLDEPQAPPLPPPNEFAGAPPIPGTLRLMAEGEAPELYLVEPGDTLFDVCDQLLDEPTYWPKLWALNPEIKNPHFIFPGMKLRFYPGDDDTPPYLQVVAEDDVIPIDKGDLDESQLVVENIRIPEDITDPAAIEVIGPAEVEIPDEFYENFLTAGQSYRGGDVQVRVPGFLYSEARQPLGFVIGGARGEYSVADGRTAVFERSGELATGSTYTVLRPRGEVVDPETGDAAGYRYDFVANVRMVKNIDADVVLGLIFETRIPVYPEDVVVAYIDTSRSVPSADAVGALSPQDANVIGFSYGGDDIIGLGIGGAGQYAFIDKGNADGISVGMNLPVYQTPGFIDSYLGNLDLPEDYRQVGVIRIIDTTDAGSVGYIVRNSQELRIGDRTTASGG